MNRLFLMFYCFVGNVVFAGCCTKSKLKGILSDCLGIKDSDILWISSSSKIDITTFQEKGGERCYVVCKIGNKYFTCACSCDVKPNLSKLEEDAPNTDSEFYEMLAKGLFVYSYENSHYYRFKSS